uniref:Uncharacterized protein n=1 Tax=Salix viminalis TaxID=40686 RepID=A0A6N2MMK4_SALVM
MTAHICLPALKIIEQSAGIQLFVNCQLAPTGTSMFIGIPGCLDRYTAGDNDFGRAKLRAPKWCERPVGASFGFGGKLVSFCPKLPAAGASQVFLHNLVTEDSLVSRSSEFESAIQNGEKSLVKALCDKKSQESDG